MTNEHPFEKEIDRDVEVRVEQQGVTVTGLAEVSSFQEFKEALQKLESGDLIWLLRATQEEQTQELPPS